MIDLGRDIYWIGGAPCGGKSTVADLIAEITGIEAYHIDEHFKTQMPALNPEKQPTISWLHELSCDENWMRPVGDQLRSAFDYYREQLEVTLSEIAQSDQVEPLIIEGKPLLAGKPCSFKDSKEGEPSGYSRQRNFYEDSMLNGRGFMMSWPIAAIRIRRLPTGWRAMSHSQPKFKQNVIS